MWVARDKDGYLQIGEDKPSLNWSKRFWNFHSLPIIVVNHGLFPEVTFENSPQEVELKIKEE